MDRLRCEAGRQGEAPGGCKGRALREGLCGKTCSQLGWRQLTARKIQERRDQVCCQKHVYVLETGIREFRADNEVGCPQGEQSAATPNIF